MLRSLLAMGEAGAWPAFAKATATWVPAEARTLAIGVCNSGSSLGAMIAPPLVVGITAIAGWRGAFVVTGAIGFLWVLAFQLFRRSHPEMAIAERAPVTPGDRVRWVELLRYRQTWAVFFCRFFADPLWFFYVFWIPEFLTRERGLHGRDRRRGVDSFPGCRRSELHRRISDPTLAARRLEPQSHAQDLDGGGGAALAAGNPGGIRAFPVLDYRDDFGGDFLLDVLVDHDTQSAGRLLSAARGGVGLRDRGDGFHAGLGDQHVGRGPHAGCHPQLCVGVHRNRDADAHRAPAGDDVDGAGRAGRGFLADGDRVMLLLLRATPPGPEGTPSGLR